MTNFARPDHGSRKPRATLVLVALIALVELGMKGEPFRFARGIDAKPGFNVLELPDDVLAEARPGLVDVRLTSPAGEIGYVFEDALASVAPRLAFRDVETRPGRETTALLDRGPAAALCAELVLEIGGAEPFLKPLLLEASPDGREFARIAQASIFRVSSGEGFFALRFPETDRRFLRVRLDDSNGPEVLPISATCRGSAAPKARARELPLVIERKEPGDGSSDAFVLRLPTPKLPVVELRLTSPDLAFSREARIYESVVFRDELSRRLAGAGQLTRSATGQESMSIALGELSGGTLELELERKGAPFTLTAVTAVVAPRRLVFVAPKSGPLELVYGSATASPPSYDLGDALKSGPPGELLLATLRAPVDRGARPSLPAPARGPALDAQGWRRRAPLELPQQGSLAYVDLTQTEASHLGEIRIVDSQHRQVPFIVEATRRASEKPVPFSTTNLGQTTTLSLTLDPSDLVSSLTLTASAPPYFERDLQLAVPVRDQRGELGKRTIATTRWQRRPDTMEASVSLPVSLQGERSALLTIADGDNPPLQISAVTASLPRRRIDFLFEPGEKLEIWSDNPSASVPRYDFELIAARVLASPAAPATRATAGIEVPVPAARGTPRWFWWVAVGAGLVVVLVLVRVGRRP